MAELVKARKPFVFYTRLNLTELTGLKAAGLSQLLKLLKKVPDSSIYHHTHNFLQQFQSLLPGSPSDFAFWVSDVLGEDELGEKLAAIDTIQYPTIAELRQAIVKTVADYLKAHPRAKKRFAEEGEEFYFLKSISFVVPNNLQAQDLKEFAEVLDKITPDSIYFHVFEARLRLHKTGNDFANWIENSLGDKKLADRISGLDPYSYTLEDLRKAFIRIINRRIFS